MEAGIVLQNCRVFNREKVRNGEGWNSAGFWLGIESRSIEESDDMARKSIEERLAQLDAQRATLKARLGKQERANDTRRKVLLGAPRAASPRTRPR